jgi:hypothetical protein
MNDSDAKLALQRLTDMAHEQREISIEMRTITAQQTEMLKKHDRVMDNLVKQGAVNTANLETHIKRTDILQSRQHKLLIMAALAMGASAIEFGPSLLRFFGLLL